MGDIAKAKRDLFWVKDAVESRNWEQAEGQAEVVERALQGLSDEEKAPVAAELAELRRQFEAGMKAEKGKRIEDEINRKIEYAMTTSGDSDKTKSILESALERLQEEDAQKYLEAPVIAALQARIAGSQGSSTADEKNRRIQNIEPLLKKLEERFAQNPFKGKSNDEAYRIRREVESWILDSQTNLKAIPSGDADAQALAARLAKMEKALTDAVADWQEEGTVGELRKSWNSTKESFAGWEDEKQGPRWEAFSEGSASGIEDLHMSKTLAAIRECTYWLRNTAEAQKEFGNVAAVKSVVTEATETLEKAAKNVHDAFQYLLDGAERASTPKTRRELEKPQRILHHIERWFDHTRFKEANVARAKALYEKWEAALDKLDREGLELYKTLEAEAAAGWPEILKTIKFESGFDPKDLSTWKNKTVLLHGVYNRAGWDFDGNDLATRINDVPVAGDYEQKISMAMDDISRRTRRPIDDHKEWHVVGVVEGPGTIKKRVQHEMTVKGTNEKIKTESWEPVDCVKIRIIALHAGPVAVGPR